MRRSPFPRGVSYSILQISTIDSSAVALGAVLAHFGLHTDLHALNHACAASSDGVSLQNLRRAAESFQLICGPDVMFPLSLEQQPGWPNEGPWLLRDAAGSCYSIFSGSVEKALIYDPRKGLRQCSLAELQPEVAFALKPAASFEQGGSPTDIWEPLKRLCAPLMPALKLLIVISTVQAIPILMIAGASSQFIDNFIDEQRVSFGLPIVWVIVIALVVNLSFSAVRYLLIRRSLYVLNRAMASDVFKAATLASSEYYMRRNLHELAGRMTLPWSLPSVICNSFLASLLQLWTSVLVLLFSIIISLPLFVLLLLGFLITLYINYLVTIASVVPQAIDSKEYMNAYSSGMNAIQNVGEIQLLSLSAEFLREWHRSFLVIVKQNQVLGRLKIFRRITINGAIFAIKALLLGLGGFLILDGRTTLGTLIAFIFIEEQVASSLFAIPNISQSWQTMNAQMRLYQEMASASRFEEPVSEELLDHPQSQASAPVLVVRDLCYAYTSLAQPVLRSIRFELASGARLALLGAAGAGKSTLTNLLVGLLTPTAGQIVCRPLAADVAAPLRDQVGFISALPKIFDGNFFNNIDLFSEDYSHQLIVDAAKRANLHGFVSSYERGYHHHLITHDVSIRGLNLYRLELARALLKQPRLLVVGDLSGSIDSELELQFLQQILELNITTVFTPSSLQAFQFSDSLLLLEQGECRCFGSTLELQADAAIQQLFASPVAAEGVA